MERVIENSNRLRSLILPEIESVVEEYRAAIYSHKHSLDSADKALGEDAFRLHQTKLSVAEEEKEILQLQRRIKELEEEVDAQTVGCAQESFATNPSENLKNKLRDYERVSMELSKALKFYQSRLGLSLKKLPNSDLRLSFEYIKPETDATEHALTISVDEHRHSYRVVSCTPSLPELPRLLRALNATNDFSRFVKDLRKAFVGLYR